MITKITFGALLLTLSACGQAPSFAERKGANSADATAGGDAGSDGTSGVDSSDENGLSGEGADGQEVLGDLDGLDPSGAGGGAGGAGGAGGGAGGAGGGGAGNGGGGELPVSEIDIPGASDTDVDALHRCLAQWKNHPFGTSVNNYYEVYAAVSVGGYGTAVNDTERTDEPFLVLVDAAVNVGGETTYNLLNPNGYYCFKVNVNVNSTLNVNLHCNARLADSRINVNVASTQNATTSTVGVNVQSDVNVYNVNPEGDSCLRQ